MHIFIWRKVECDSIVFFIIIYVAIRVALIISFYVFKKSDWGEHGESVIMTNIVSIFFYVSLLLQSSGFILLSLIAIIVTNIKNFCKHFNKYVLIISVINIGELISVIFPTMQNYFDRPLFSGATFEIFFLFWKVV